MATTPQTQLFMQVREMLETLTGWTDDDDAGPIHQTTRNILTSIHLHYRAQQHDFIIDIHNSPFEDKVLTQIIALTYRDLLRQIPMAELALQEKATLDFTADPLTELTLGFSKATCQLLESIWKTFTTKIARTQAKAEADLAEAKAKTQEE